MKPVIPGLEEALSGIEYTDKLGEAPETLLDGVDLMIISPDYSDFRSICPQGTEPRH